VQALFMKTLLTNLTSDPLNHL